VSDSTFSENGASSTGGGSALGGAIFGSDLDIERSLFSGNETVESAESVLADGGAVRTFENTRITNTTFYDNESADIGGAIKGGGVLSHVTFESNTGDTLGDDVSGNPLGSEDVLVLRNSIFTGFIFTDLCAPSAILSKGYSLAAFDDSDCKFRDSDVTGVLDNSIESSPSDHGGPTDTISIGKDSPAKDLVPLRKCKLAEGTDQRGYKRPAGKRCDAGAFERGAKP
jgi:hypothetical protein